MMKDKTPFNIDLSGNPEHGYDYGSIIVDENESKEKIESLIMERVPQEWELVTWKKSDHQ